MTENAPFLAGWSPVAGKPVHLAFDGGRLTSDGSVLVLAEIERKLQIAERLAGCIADPRAPERVRHGFAEMIRFRSLLIAAGDEDADDCNALRDDPAFKMAVGRRPETGAELCSQPTMCRLENRPTTTTPIRMMTRLAGLLAGSASRIGSTSSARASSRCRGAFCSTPSTGCTAASNCRCSMRITTAAASCRSTSTRR